MQRFFYKRTSIYFTINNINRLYRVLVMLNKINFKDKNKKSLNNDQRILTDVNINEIKSKVNAIIDHINQDIENPDISHDVYTKEEVNAMIQEVKENIIDEESLLQINQDFNELNNIIKDL